MSGAEWRSASLPSLQRGSGGEQIARAALAQIKTNVDAQCSLLETQWLPRDQDWAANFGIPFVATTINRPVNYYLGAQPSLVMGDASRFDKWPAITCRVGVRRPLPLQPDQWGEYNVELIVETLASAGPFQQQPLDDRSTSDAVDRQYQRLADAVAACIDLDLSLGGNTPGIQTQPTMTPSSPFVMHVQQGRGPWMVYQAMELRWPVTTLSR